MKRSFLKRRTDFLRTYKGQSFRGHCVIGYVCPNNMRTWRLGITVPKKIGTAVLRNRIKRWSRQVFRTIDLPDYPLDVNMVVKPPQQLKRDFRNVDFAQYQEEMYELFDKIITRYKRRGPSH